MTTKTMRRMPPNRYPETLPLEQLMPNSDWHSFLLGLILQALRWHYRDDDRAVASGDMFVYFDGGKSLAPDVFVCRNAEKAWRTNWIVDTDGPIEFVIELASKNTIGEDTGHKRDLYRDTLKVREYFIFDAVGDLLVPRLQGWRLVEGEYVRIEPVDGRLPSEVTGLYLERDGEHLRFWDPATGEWVPFDYERAEFAEALLEHEREERQEVDGLLESEREERQRVDKLLEEEAAARRAASARADRATELAGKEKLRADEAEEKLRKAEAALAQLQAAKTPGDADPTTA